MNSPEPVVKEKSDPDQSRTFCSGLAIYLKIEQTMRYFFQPPVTIGLLLIFFLVTCDNDESVLVLDDYNWEQEQINDFNNDVYSPSAMWIDQNGMLVIQDMGDRNQPIKILRDGVVFKSISSGRGPGEVEYVLRKSFSESKNSRYIFDPAQMRMLSFDEEYNYLEDLVDERINDGVYRSGIYSDSLLFTTSSDYILQIINLHNVNKNHDPLFTLRHSDHEFLDPLRNYFLRQSFFFASEGQDFYMALKHSSMIMHIDEEFNLNYTFGPDSIGIAINEDDGFYALPRLGQQREGLRDLQVHGDNLYVVLNGETYGKHIQIRHMANFDSLLDVVGHGKILLIFDRHTLEYKRAIELPVAASQIAVNDDHISLLNYIDDAPAIYVYKNYLN